MVNRGKTVHLKEILSLLIEKGADINITDIHSRTPLHQVCFEKHANSRGLECEMGQFHWTVDIFQSETILAEFLIRKCELEGGIVSSIIIDRTLVVIGTDCTGSCKSNYLTITTTTVPLSD
jgi:hypothetical protein